MWQIEAPKRQARHLSRHRSLFRSGFADVLFGAYSFAASPVNFIQQPLFNRKQHPAKPRQRRATRNVNRQQRLGSPQIQRTIRPAAHSVVQPDSFRREHDLPKRVSDFKRWSGQRHSVLPRLRLREPKLQLHGLRVAPAAFNGDLTWQNET